jgi:hypothetical protein
MTISSFETFKQELEAARMTDCLMKPFMPAALVACVREHVVLLQTHGADIDAEGSPDEASRKSFGSANCWAVGAAKEVLSEVLPRGRR